MKYSEYELSLLDKFNKGEQLRDDELEFIALELEFKIEEGALHRWTQEVTSICDLAGTTVAVNWMRALTEMQEHEFWEQPYEVVEVQRQITTTRWVAKSLENLY